jgi:uncharacterized protein (DUF3084 family)
MTESCVCVTYCFIFPVVFKFFSQDCPKAEPRVDDTDIDLLHLRCSDLEAERDAAWEELDKVRAERDEAIHQRDKAISECRTWEKAAESATSLIRLAAGVQYRKNP